MADPARPLLDPPGAPVRWHRYVCLECRREGYRVTLLLPLPPEVDPPARYRLACGRCWQRDVARGECLPFTWHAWDGEAPAPAPGKW